MNSLTRIPLIRNPNYKPGGLKSYAYLLNKCELPWLLGALHKILLLMPWQYH